jgi:membrane fusion protein (multidrug efflux system)
VPELVLSSLRTGQVIHVTVDAVPGRTFEGKIYAIDPAVDVNGRAVRLRARIANPDRLLFPGLFARVQIVIERRENAVLVPESAVFSRGHERLVYRVVEGRAVLTKVELGQRRPGEVEVTDGLGHDAMVVTAGHQKLRDGARVEIVDASAGI